MGGKRAAGKGRRPERARRDYAALREQARALYLRESITTRSLAERLGLSRKAVENWCKVGGWVERRKELRAELYREDLDRVREKLRFELPGRLESNVDDVAKLVDRFKAVLLNDGAFCPHCGADKDTRKRPQVTPAELLALMKWEMEIRGAADPGQRQRPVVEELPAVPEPLMLEFARWMARVYGAAAPAGGGLGGGDGD